MKEQTKKRLLESVAFVIVTFCISLCLSPGNIRGLAAYLGCYIGHMSMAIIISLVISLIYFVATKRFWRFFLNSLWITSAISFYIISRPMF